MDSKEFFKDLVNCFHDITEEQKRQEISKKLLALIYGCKVVAGQLEADDSLVIKTERLCGDYTKYGFENMIFAYLTTVEDLLGKISEKISEKNS